MRIVKTFGVLLVVAAACVTFGMLLGTRRIPAGFMAGLGATIFLFLCAMPIAGITARIAEAVRFDPYWGPAIVGSAGIVAFTVLYWIVRLGAAT